MKVSCRYCVRIMAFGVAVLAFMLSGFSGYCDAGVQFNVDCFFGWQGCYRPMEWTPVDIMVSSNLKQPFAGVVSITAQQDDLNIMTIVRDFVLTPDMPQHLPLVTKLAFNADEASVRVTDANGSVKWKHNYSIYDFSRRKNTLTVVKDNDLLIGLVGRNGADIMKLPDNVVCVVKNDNMDKGDVYVKRKLPRMVPWDWTGFASLDLLILYNPDWSLFRAEQKQAIVQWVKNGGHLLVIAGSHILPHNDVLARLLPFEMSQPRQLTIPHDLLESLNWQCAGGNRGKKGSKVAGGIDEAVGGFDSNAVSDNTPVLSYLLRPKPATTIYKIHRYNDSQGLFGVGYVGFGRVGVLGFDPADMVAISGGAGRQGKVTAAFWVNIIRQVLQDNLLPRSISPGDSKGSKQIITTDSSVYRYWPLARAMGGEISSDGNSAYIYGSVKGVNYIPRYAGYRNIVVKTDKPENSSGMGRYYDYQLNLSQLGLNGIMNHLYGKTQPISIWWVVLLLGLLAILLGPVDYLVLKGKELLPLTWVTTTFWIVVFTVGAYYGVQIIRGGKLTLKMITVTDGFADTGGIAGDTDNYIANGGKVGGNAGSVWQTDYASIFSPRSDSYKLQGIRAGQWFAGISPSMERIYSFRRGSAGNKIYYAQYDGGNRPLSVPVSIWSWQCLMCESRGGEMPFEASLSQAGRKITLTIHNKAQTALSEGRIILAAGSFLFGVVPAGATKTFCGPLEKFRLPDWVYFASNSLSPGSGNLNMGHKSVEDIAGVAQGCLRRSRGMVNYLYHGAALICAKYIDTPVTFGLNNNKYKVYHTQIVRQVIWADSGGIISGSKTKKRGQDK